MEKYVTLKDFTNNISFFVNDNERMIKHKNTKERAINGKSNE